MQGKASRPPIAAALFLLAGICCRAQVYSPVVVKAGQPDATSLTALAQGIYQQAHAATPREKAEAIWRFFLTDGRFVKPGFWYHIAGWAYEEPMGEVLDPIKLLNSYGFGLCYHIAPLLAAMYDAGGFEDSRVWFLTGHTVAEVFYDGGYHYFDSDMMGYNPVGGGPLKQRRVASVHDIERNGNIILGKMKGPKDVEPAAVDYPWYPADVRAGAIGGLAELFTTTKDNRLYGFKRYPQGHSMDFVLRPGERMIRYFRPESPQLYYLPFQFNGTAWREFPQEIAKYHIRTNDGPRSQKDNRSWATGRIEYRPQLKKWRSSVEFDMPCPYVIIDAQFTMSAELSTKEDTLRVATSVDGGRTWTDGTTLQGPFHGKWTALPATVVKSEHGTQTAVSGTYGYRVRIDSSTNAQLQNVLLATRFELNPRTLPELTPGNNELQYRSTTQDRIEIPVRADTLDRFASKIEHARYSGSNGQGYVINQGSMPGEITFALAAPDGHELTAFDAGGRFLDLRDGLAPDKLTAEVRKVTPWPSKNAPAPAAQLAWAANPNGPYQELWTYNPKLSWKDGQPIDRILRWPEVDKHIGRLPPGTKKVYVRYMISGMAIDDFRLATINSPNQSSSSARVTQVWKENGILKSHAEPISAGIKEHEFSIDIPESTTVENEAIIVECLQ
jgi:hypothetical protein